MNISEYQNYFESKVHTSADFPYNTYLCTIPLDFTQVPVHWHNEAEIISIKQGRGMISIDLQEFPAGTGDIILILPGQLHAIRQLGQERMEYENILFMPSLLENGAKDLCAERFLEPVFTGRACVDTIYQKSLPYYPEIRRLIDDIDSLCARRPYGYQLLIKSRLYAFFFLLVSHQKKDSAPARRAKSLEKIKQIIKYIEEHYAEPISIQDMARLSCYSPSHFMKFFRENMGNSFTAYLNDYRLTIAARLLRASRDSILEIALQSGFENPSYFNRMFRRKYGMTPSEYRKQ